MAIRPQQGCGFFSFVPPPDPALISDCALDRKSNAYNKSTSVIPLFIRHPRTGRRAIAEATKKRWAAFHAAKAAEKPALAKKTASKKAVAKKAAVRAPAKKAVKVVRVAHLMHMGEVRREQM